MNCDQKITVVDDDKTLCGSMRWLLESLKLNVETYTSAREFLSNYDPEQPGCLVLDVRMPEVSGLQLQDLLLKRGIRIPVILVTGYGDVSTAVRAMKMGALDFIEKPFNDQDLLESVQRALALDARQRQDQERQRIANERLASLTCREREVLERVMRGQLNKVIAAEFGISMKTVEAHRARVMEKLDVRTPLELASVYVAAGGYRGQPPAGPVNTRNLAAEEGFSSAEKVERGLAVNI